MLHLLYTPHSIKLPVKHTLTLPPSYLIIHSFIVILLYHLLFSLHLFYGYALYNLAIQATETNKCDLILSMCVVLGTILGCVIFVLFVCSVAWLFLLGCQYQYK